jgi:hypothetical protein
MPEAESGNNMARIVAQRRLPDTVTGLRSTALQLGLQSIALARIARSGGADICWPAAANH